VGVGVDVGVGVGVCDTGKFDEEGVMEGVQLGVIDGLGQGGYWQT
jgi:hypothetical protein